MSNLTKTPSEKTILFAALSPDVAVLINDVIHAIYTILAWSQASKSFLTEILSRLAETDSFSQGHADFSAALWSHLEAKRRREKISRWIRKLKSDMELSRFSPIFIPKQIVIRANDGGFKGQATVYKIGHFWKLFRYVQDNAREIDLLSLPINKRRAHVRVFVGEWLNEAGAKRIIREKKEKEKSERERKEKAPSLPCACDCASCVHCASKSATASEAKGARPAEAIVRTDAKAVDAQIEDALERLFAAGQGWVNLGLRVNDFTRKVWERCQHNEERLLEAVKRHNKNGGLRFVGGQLK